MEQKMQSFQSLDEYLNENYLFEDEEKSSIGNIISKGLSFVPRAMRFKKAKEVMNNSLNGYIKKSKRLIQTFSKSLTSRMDVIDKQYQSMMKNEINKLIDNNSDVQATKKMQQFLKEIEDYKEAQLHQLNDGIKNIYNSYSNSVDKRIDTPGFVLNVELSEKGKGELKAKWQELSAKATLKVDEAKEQIMTTSGWKKLNDIISEATAFIDEYGGRSSDISFNVSLIEIPKSTNHWNYTVRVHLVKLAGAQIKIAEKGIIISNNINDLDKNNANAQVLKSVDKYKFKFGDYAIPLNKSFVENNQNAYILPYYINAKNGKIYEGDMITIFDGLKAGGYVNKNGSSSSSHPNNDPNQDDEQDIVSGAIDPNAREPLIKP